MEKIKIIAENKRVYHDFEILDTLEAGISLIGPEVKSIRNGKVSLSDSYVSFIHNEAILKNVSISIYKEATYNNHEEKRDRKLLLHKSEIRKYYNKCRLSGLTCVVTKMYFRKGMVKVEIALARGKSLYDKRESAKRKEMQKNADKALKY